MVIFSILGWLTLYQVFAAGQDDDRRRPFWNIAHMVNAIYQIDYYLNKGANSIEFDLWFDNDGEVRYTYHGVPCDCFRSCLRYEKIEDYLDYMRQVTTSGNPKFREQLVLLFLDFKVKSLSSSARRRAGSSVAKKLLQYYWRRGESTARAYVLLSIPAVGHVEVVRGFRDTLREEKNYHQYEEKVGFDFSGNEDLDLIHYVLRTENITKRVWQGDGITNCLPRGTSRLRDAVRKRDQDGTFIEKVYWWTVDKESTMRTVLGLNIDGMITNYPERLADLLKQRPFSSTFRMATIEENPWSKHPLMTAALYSMSDGGTAARGGNITNMSIIYDNDEDELLYNC